MPEFHPVLLRSVWHCGGGKRGVQKISAKNGSTVAALEVKVDSYLVETDVYFPKDLNLI